MKPSFSCSPCFARVILLLFISTHLFAQKNNFPGYYVNLQNDTVRGVFGAYKPWNYSPRAVDFTASAGGSHLRLEPANCTAFCVENYDTYISYTGSRMTNAISFSAASSQDEVDKYDTVKVFLRQIASSKQYQFYIYKDERRINLYYAGAGKAATELLQKSAVINNVYWRSMRYRQQLRELFPSEGRAAQIERMDYSEESLAAFVKSQEGGSASPGKAKHSNGGLVLLAGGSYNSFTSAATPQLDFSGRKYSSGTVPVVAAGYLVSLNRNFHRVFLFPEIKVFSFKHSTLVHYSISNAYPAVSHTFQSAPVVSLIFHAGYYLIDKDNLSVALAPGGGFSVLVRNRLTDQYRNSPTETKAVVTEMSKGAALADLYAFVLFKKRYLIWSSYHLPVQITTYNTSAGKLSSVQCGAGVKF